MAKTKEEINQMIAKFESSLDTLHKLSDDELNEVSGGTRLQDIKYEPGTCFYYTNTAHDDIMVCFYIKFGIAYERSVKYLVSRFFIYEGEHCPGHDFYKFESEIESELANGTLSRMDYQI